MKNLIKSLTLLMSVGFLSVAFMVPTNAKLKTEAPKCSPQACETAGGVGICCLVGTSSMSCSPCGAFEPIKPTPEIAP